MSAEQTLYGWLTADSSLAAYVDERIYPDVIPQEASLPAIAYARASTAPVMTIHGDVAGQFVNLQVQCWAPTRAEAEAVADAVAAILQGQKEGYTARGGLFDEATGAFGAVVDVSLFVV